MFRHLIYRSSFKEETENWEEISVILLAFLSINSMFTWLS